jgi:hypothetical protein
VVSLAQRRRLRRVTLNLFYKTDRIPSFDIRHSIFIIRYSLFCRISFLIRPAALQAGGWADI